MLVSWRVVIYPNPCIITVIHIPSLHIQRKPFCRWSPKSGVGVEFFRRRTPWGSAPNDRSRDPKQMAERWSPTKIHTNLACIYRPKKEHIHEVRAYPYQTCPNKMWRNTLGTCDPRLLFPLNPKETCLFAFISATGNNESVAHFSPFTFSWVVIGNFLFFGNIYIKSMCPVGKEVNLGSEHLFCQKSEVTWNKIFRITIETANYWVMNPKLCRIDIPPGK